MRPIVWGVIWLFIGMIGWIAFSVFAGISEFVEPGKFDILDFLVYLFGVIFFFSLPFAVLAEFVLYIRKRKRKHQKK